MSDKLILTLLGAIGIGALVMGMNEENKLKEDWMGIQGIQMVNEKVEVDAETGDQVGTVEPNDKNVINAVLNLGKAGRKASRESEKKAAMEKHIKENYEDRERYEECPDGNCERYNDEDLYGGSGEPYDNGLYTGGEPYTEDEDLYGGSGERYTEDGLYTDGERYTEDGLYTDGERYAEEPCDPSTDPNCQAEYFEDSYHLGSGMVADDNIFHRNPQFNQSIPQPSPDMQTLGVPARMHVASMQGYTESFNQPMQYANFIESYQDPKPTKQPSAQQKNGGASLPPSDMNNPDSNVIVFERLMATTRGGGRFNRSGTVDYIRGDIPVCPDPCQSGWFKSSAKPQDVLQIGAVAQMIAGDNTAKDLEMLLKNHGRIIQQFTPSDMASTASKTGGTVGTKQLP
jgi:hypothetical protein